MKENKIKDFDKWNNYKKLLERTSNRFTIHEGDIWNCYVGENVGYEECGKNEFLRPIIVVRKLVKMDL